MRVPILSCVLALLLTSVVNNLANAELVGYWSMDGDTKDQTSNGLDGELFGDTAFTDDTPDALAGGQSLLLNAEFVEIGGVPEDEIDAEDNAGYVDLGNPDLLNFGENDFTIAAWMKVPDALFERGNIFSNGGDNGGGVRYVLAYRERGGESIVLTTDDNSDKFQTGANDFDYPVDDGEWYHVVGQREGNELRVFVNGEFAGENLDLVDGYDLSGSDQQPAYIGLGADSGTGDFEKYFQGWVDDVAIWDEALSEEQIATVMSGDFSEWLGEELVGDFNMNGVLDLADIDDLTQKSAGAQHPPTYDLNADSLVDDADVEVWIKDLFGSWVGDADLDGLFDTGDLVSVLASGTYEADVDSVWSTGDFTGNGRTDTGDLVAALSDGGYENGPRAAVAAVPEPTAMVLILMGLIGLLRTRRR